MKWIIPHCRVARSTLGWWSHMEPASNLSEARHCSCSYVVMWKHLISWSKRSKKWERPTRIWLMSHTSSYIQMAQRWLTYLGQTSRLNWQNTRGEWGSPIAGSLFSFAWRHTLNKVCGYFTPVINIFITKNGADVFVFFFLAVRDKLMTDPSDTDSQLAITSRSAAGFSRSDCVVCSNLILCFLKMYHVWPHIS